jgi:hypothetical protein
MNDWRLTWSYTDSILDHKPKHPPDFPAQTIDFRPRNELAGMEKRRSIRSKKARNTKQGRAHGRTEIRLCRSVDQKGGSNIQWKL